MKQRHADRPVVALALALAVSRCVGQSDRPAAVARPAGPSTRCTSARSARRRCPGRISDLAVYEANPAIFYVGTAHGGVWKTTNNGTTFEAAVPGPGPDVDRRRRPCRSRTRTSSGSAPASRTTARARRGATASTSPPTAARPTSTWGCAPRSTSTASSSIRATTTSCSSRPTGSLWGPGGERGVYKTTDGGKTWKQVLKVDDDTGANDLAMDPSNNKSCTPRRTSGAARPAA